MTGQPAGRPSAPEPADRRTGERSRDHPPTAGPEPGAAPSGARRRPGRRAVRRGPGEAEPLVDLRSVDDSDVGWQPGADDSNDDRLRRDVPPHW
jgi:hypothetical protein